MCTYHPDELEKLNQSWIEKIVSVAIAEKKVDYWLEEIAFDDVPIVKLLLQTHNLPHET